MRGRPAARRCGATAVLLLLFGGSLWVYDQPGFDVDLFEDGHVLGPAQAYLAGGRPYVDTYPVHGWGSDGGVDAFFFRTFSPSLETFRLRRAVWTALAFPALALAALALFRNGAWATLAVLLALSISPFLSERQTLAFAALAVLAAAARLRSPRLWFFAGIVSALTLFFTLDLGVMLLGGGLLAAAALGMADRSGREATFAAGSFLAGAAIASTPFVARLAARGSLADFVRVSFVQVPATILDAWGLPAGTSAELVVRGNAYEALRVLFRGDQMPALFFVLVLALAVTLLTARFMVGNTDAADRGIAGPLCVSVAALRGVLGRADAGHLAFYGVFVALPAAWLVYRAAHARRYRVAFTAMILAAVFLRWRPDRALATEWTALRLAPLARRTASSQPRIPRSGRATVSTVQARDIASLREAIAGSLGPGETFFDYSNEPALYFLLDRAPPVRYGIVPFYETETQQREVITSLEAVRPPLAILSGGGFDWPDGISIRERTPAGPGRRGMRD
jgi:hypothetical protein